MDSEEGVLSLSRAFQYAGSDATITSLWRVPDKETSIIMKRFYEYLKEGLLTNETGRAWRADCDAEASGGRPTGGPPPGRRDPRGPKPRAAPGVSGAEI